MLSEDDMDILGKNMGDTLYFVDGLMHVGCDSWAENVKLLIPCDVIVLN